MTHANQSTMHTVRRLVVPLGQPYGDAVRRFEQLVPNVDTARFSELDNWDAVVELADKEAPFGFMRYGTLHVRELMTGSQAGWDCVQYLMGNHVIAERMFRHDPAVMLHAPLRVLIQADQSGQAVFVIDQPSTLFSSYGNADIAAVGRDLDDKVAGVLVALGAEAPRVLTEHAPASG
ncbi:DUF302 domain-containing protein [Nonomuraea sp. NPDC000554]|uniref:DUF302 domain-containing protein n=1 Tax=Nonomuraea sp. NPDC000554 TaxID=3154259 RepID=UPI003327CC18